MYYFFQIKIKNHRLPYYSYFFVLLSKIEDLSTDKLNWLADTRKVDSYENISKKQLENIFISPSGHTPIPKPAQT